jgi:hypothetical protein
MGTGQFLRRSLVQMADPRWRSFALLFFMFLGGTNALLALTKPADGELPGGAFVLGALVRILALTWISVAALRVAAESPRRPWSPDGGLGLYFLLSLLSLVLGIAGGALVASLPEPQRVAFGQLIAAVMVAPFTVWIVAAAIELPTAWSPMPHFRRFGAWLPQLLLWAVLLVVPLACLHAWTTFRMVVVVGQEGFWPLALADALLSTLLVLLTLALRLTAYRSVAQR